MSKNNSILAYVGSECHRIMVISQCFKGIWNGRMWSKLYRATIKWGLYVTVRYVPYACCCHVYRRPRCAWRGPTSHHTKPSSRPVAIGLACAGVGVMGAPIYWHPPLHRRWWLQTLRAPPFTPVLKSPQAPSATKRQLEHFAFSFSLVIRSSYLD